MSRQDPQTEAPLVEFGVWSKSMTSENVSGDSYQVKLAPAGVLLAVSDGVGHGAEAAEASKVAMSCVEGYAGHSLISLFQRCDALMKRTRGAVMSAAWFNGVDSTMTWLGVGNIEGILLRADANTNPPRETILLRGGVVGLNLPQLFASVMPILPGDTLVFATDGIYSSFADTLTVMDSPQRLAEKIGSQFCKGTDDALVVTGRYCGR